MLVYPYLWARERDGGATEGRKPRRVAVGVRMTTRDAAGRDSVILFPITSQDPDEGVLAIEIPEGEKRGAGLSEGKRLWIVLDEYNRDVVGASYYLDPAGPVGAFGKAFFAEVLMLALKEIGSADVVDRRA